jgi:hypothetical protein
MDSDEFEFDLNPNLPIHFTCKVMKWNIFEDTLGDLKDLPEPDEVIPDLESLTKDFSLRDKVFGAEVGDDRIDISNSRGRLEAALQFQENPFMMKTSLKDTFITQRLWNFCEVSSPLPDSREQSFEKARLSGTFENLGFVDTVPLRIIIDCSKADKSHSSTTVGKSAMLGTRLDTPRLELREMLMLASYLQDGILSTCRSPDPKYLPSIMGGSGCPALFDNHWNIYLYTRSYRGGGYHRLYASATEELRHSVQSIDDGRPQEPALCLRLRDRQEYLHGTYSNVVAIPPKTAMQFNRDLPPPLYKAMGIANEVQGVELRLQRTKALVTRELAEREWDKTVRIHDVIFGANTTRYAESLFKAKSFEERQKFGYALQSNSAFKNLLDRKAKGNEIQQLVGQGFNISGYGQTHFTVLHAKWIFNGCRAGYASVKDLSRSSDMFIRTDVSKEETFKVGNIPLRIRLNGITRETRTKTTVGLYQINESMKDWSNRLLDNLKTLQGQFTTIPREYVRNLFSDNREWVNDDTGLIAKCLHDTRNVTFRCCVILISQDQRLANQMCKQANVYVILLDTSEVVEHYPRKVWSSDDNQVTLEEIRKGFHSGYYFPLPPAFLYIDTGSLAHVASRYTRGSRGRWDRRLYKKTNIKVLTRGEEYLLESVTEPGKFLSPRLFKPSENRQRKYRITWSHTSSGSSSSSWRSKETLSDNLENFGDV